MIKPDEVGECLSELIGQASSSYSWIYNGLLISATLWNDLELKDLGLTR